MVDSYVCRKDAKEVPDRNQDFHVRNPFYFSPSGLMAPSAGSSLDKKPSSHIMKHLFRCHLSRLQIGFIFILIWTPD